MQGDAFVEGFLGDENLLRASDAGLGLYSSADTIRIDRGTC